MGLKVIYWLDSRALYYLYKSPPIFLCFSLYHYFLVYFVAFAAAAAESLQSCPTLCDPIDSSPPGSPIPGILQARTLEWVAISFSNAWKWKVKVKSLSHVWLCATPWTVAHQAPPSMGFSRQAYWSGVPLPSPYHTPVFLYSSFSSPLSFKSIPSVTFSCSNSWYDSYFLNW